ncbi:putative dehydrogenase [Maribacter vaceletii]|uniref:Putative dehydrogenase n=1 Tax=Maribacter vaceletii TaxID=1206816 RepID=A0A495E6R2_9FLAO|nr:Gfo/Idh/MocA family oxidoreductase [Maribacter vaceletii]RKR12259.1 putative dehydrogenase [Maribacter vaceletii]
MKRRDFVIKGSIASVAVASSTTALANTLNFTNAANKLTIGIIGTGDRGSGLIPLINEIDNFKVVACCDTLPFRLENGLSKAPKKAKGYADYRKLLDNPDIDAVLISTPFNTHSKIALDALDAGKHVYCEKTMAKGLDGIQHLIQKTKNSNKIFQTGHQYHSSRLYTHVVDLIKNGKVGKITSFDCQWNRNGNWRRPVPKPELEKVINWRMYREFSGGLVAELCSHQIDFVNWVLDATPNKVMGIGGIDYWKDGRETYDNVNLMYEYPNGIKAKFTCLTSNAKDGYQIIVKGDKGTIIMGTRNAWFYPEGTKNKKIGTVDGVAGATVTFDKNKGYPIKVEHQNPSKQALQDFKDSITLNSSPISNITTGANTAIAVQMGLEAMHTESIVKWPSKIS